MPRWKFHFNRLISNSYSQFDSSLAALRVGYYLESKGFPILNWGPIPKSGNAGEFTVACPSGGNVFVEVKSPGWESELEKNELKVGRAKQEKYQDNEGRWIGPSTAIQFAIRKAYKKFDPASSNFLVVVWTEMSTGSVNFCGGAETLKAAQVLASEHLNIEKLYIVGANPSAIMPFENPPTAVS